ncbi:MAG: PH domain-containing protein, partial [Methanobrevibacter sp.]|nr:PH domain-containing protein [Methanobrevibacter sp.]
MLFNKNDERTNERVLYKTKPNMVLGCRKAIFGVVLLALVFMISPTVIQFIGRMQVYMISQIQLPLTRFAAIGFFVVILVIILYIIWQLITWYSMEYTLTDTRIIIKSGVLSTKKSYMPYTTIQ